MDTLNNHIREYSNQLCIPEFPFGFKDGSPDLYTRRTDCKGCGDLRPFVENVRSMYRQD